MVGDPAVPTGISPVGEQGERGPKGVPGDKGARGTPGEDTVGQRGDSGDKGMEENLSKSSSSCSWRIFLLLLPVLQGGP